MAPEDPLANQVIDDALIDELSKRDPRPEKRAALEKYRGNTWKQALKEHSELC